MILSPTLADIERSAQSDAERKIARILSAIPEPDCVAFWSKKLRTHPTKQQSEADFVILWKGVVLVIEAKGGGVKKFEGRWYSSDRRGDWHLLRESPMDQAQSAAYALREILRSMNAGWVRLGAMVVTPDIEHPPESIEWKGSQWLAKESMNRGGLAAGLDAAKADLRPPSPGAKVESLAKVRDALFGEFALLPVIDAQRGAVIDEQNLATFGQARVLSGLSRNQRILVRGGAGTGKSLVLAEAAKQEAEEGRSVLITFRSPGLRSLFESRVSGSRVAVKSFDELDAGEKCDVLLVDEAQDLMSADAIDRLDQALTGGIAGGRWRMFLDHNNQAQVDGRFDPEVLELVSAEAMDYSLNTNVRNTKAIVHVVQEYLGADVGDPGIVNGERIQWHWVEGADGVVEANTLAQDMKATGTPASSIWIIPVEGYPDADSVDHGIRVVSPKIAKGLEADHVIVCDLPTIFDDAAIAAFYVAVTRARVTLHIVATQADKKRLRALVRARG